MAQYAVMHVEKGKSGGGAIGNHIDRKEGKEHSYSHADPDKKHLNANFRLDGDVHLKPLDQAIEDRIKEGYSGKVAIRKDAVRYLKINLSGSHEEMTAIFRDKEKAKEWVKANKKWAEEEFGRENIVRFTLHRDEKTPHIHLVVVPLTKDGRLSAKEVMGNPKAMSERQTRYAQFMEPFSLQRGVIGSKIKHTDAKWYYGQLQQLKPQINIENEFKRHQKFLFAIPSIEKPPALGRERWQESINKGISDHITEEVNRIDDEVITPLKTALESLVNGQQFNFDQQLKEKRELEKELSILRNKNFEISFQLKHGITFAQHLKKEQEKDRQNQQKNRRPRL